MEMFPLCFNLAYRLSYKDHVVERGNLSVQRRLKHKLVVNLCCVVKQLLS